MYEHRGAGVRRYLLAPVAGYTFVVISALAVVLVLHGGWVALVAPVWLSWLMWRASRLRLRVDTSGITIVNLFRSHVIGWAEVRGVLVDHAFHDFPATLSIERARGRLRGVAVHVVLGVGARQRRDVALHVAKLGRTYGYGFPAGDVRDIEELHRAGLIDETDASAHEAWWNARDRVEVESPKQRSSTQQ